MFSGGHRSARKGKGARLVLAVTLMLASSLISACTASESPVQGSSSSAVPAPPVPTPTSTSLCGIADELKPEQALELIEKIRAPYAPQEASPRSDCETERANALRALGVEQFNANHTPPTAAMTSQDLWDKFVKSWVIPWQERASTWAGLVLGLLVLARLLALLPRPAMPPKFLPWQRASRVTQWILLLVGILMILWLPWLLLDSFTRPPDAFFGKEVLLSILALVGSFVLASWMAARQRLSLVVRAKDGSPSEFHTTYLIALLQDVAGGRARGLEIPRATDATGLNDVPLTAALNNGVLSALQKTLQMIFSLAPWRVVIDSNADETLSVVITRNGWSAGAVRIDRNDRLLFPEALTTRPATPVPENGILSQEHQHPDAGPVPTLDAYKMAAAFIVATLSLNYQGYEGLGGATDWRGIGLQFIATTDLADNVDEQTILLAQALELDPRNLPAEAALRNLAYRHPQKPESDQQICAQKAYAKWLAGQAETLRKRPKGQRALLYRLWFSYLCVALNLEASGARLKPDEGPDPVDVSHLLMEALTESHPETEALEKRMRPHAALAYFDLESKKKRELCEQKKPELDKEKKLAREKEWCAWQDEAMLSLAPTLAYNSACSLACRNDTWEKVKARLEVACGDSSLKAIAPYDPELTRYAKTRPQAEKYLSDLKEKSAQGMVAKLLALSGSFQLGPWLVSFRPD